MCFLLRIVLTLALFSLVPANDAHAQTKPAFSPTALALIQQELGETPQLLLWADAKTLRASSFYSGMSNTVDSLYKKTVASSKCLRKTKFSDFDYALLLGADFDLPKERGYLAVSGSFDAPKLLQCMASEFKWTQSRVDGILIYQETSGNTKSIIYAAGKNTFVLLAGTWAKPLAPNSGTLGKGSLASLAGGSVLSFKYEPPSGAQDFKIAECMAVAGTELSLMGNVTFHKTKTAMDWQKKADEAKKQVAALGLPVSKNLKITRTNKRIEAEASVTTAEFVMLLNFIENAMGNGSNSANPPSTSPAPAPAKP